MLTGIQINRVEDPIHHILAMTRQQRRNVNAPLLQILFRIKQVESAFELTLQCFIARNLRALKACAQTIDLIVDFAAAFIERFSQRLIDLPQFILERVKLVIKCLGGVIESFRSFFAQMLFHDFSDDLIVAGKKIFQSYSIAFQSPPGVSLNQRDAGAVENRSDGAIERR